MLTETQQAGRFYLHSSWTYTSLQHIRD